MTYTFTETDRGNIILKTVDKVHTNLSGWQEFSTEYPDSIVTDRFYIISHTKSDEDSEGNCYDWYDVKNHYRQIDKTPPIAESVSELENAICESDITNANKLEASDQHIADIENVLCTQDTTIDNLSNK